MGGTRPRLLPDVGQSGVALRAFLGDLLWPSLMPAVPMLVVLYTLRQLFQPQSYLGVGSIGLAGAAVYALLYIVLSGGKPEQVLLRRLAADFKATAMNRARPGAKDTYGVPK